MMENSNNEFTKLENKAIGHQVRIYRMMRDMKALEMAERLGLKEAAYTKYERGETSITIEFIQKVAEIINIDPIQLMTITPGHMIENGNNSHNAVLGNNIEGDFNNQSVSKEQNEAILTLINSQIELSKKLTELLDKK